MPVIQNTEQPVFIRQCNFTCSIDLLLELILLISSPRIGEDFTIDGFMGDHAVIYAESTTVDDDVTVTITCVKISNSSVRRQ